MEGKLSTGRTRNIKEHDDDDIVTRVRLEEEVKRELEERDGEEEEQGDNSMVVIRELFRQIE